MNSIQNLIDTHTVFGMLGQICFLVLGMLILRWRRAGRSFSTSLRLATTLPAILGIASAYLQWQDARRVMNTTLASTVVPDLAVRSIFWMLGTGIAASFILLALGAFFLPRKQEEKQEKQKRERTMPARKESPVGSFSSIRGALGRDCGRAARTVSSAGQV